MTAYSSSLWIEKTQQGYTVHLNNQRIELDFGSKSEIPLNVRLQVAALHRALVKSNLNEPKTPQSGL